MSFTSTQRYGLLALYFIGMSILFCLPGSVLPKEGWLDKIWFDKWVHIGLFTVFTYLISWAIPIRVTKRLLTVFIAAVVYGISVEVVQDQFIPNRSFDLTDWAADSIGSFIGVWVWNLRYIKK